MSGTVSDLGFSKSGVSCSSIKEGDANQDLTYLQQYMNYLQQSNNDVNVNWSFEKSGDNISESCMSRVKQISSVIGSGYLQSSSKGNVQSFSSPGAAPRNWGFF